MTPGQRRKAIEETEASIKRQKLILHHYESIPRKVAHIDHQIEELEAEKGKLFAEAEEAESKQIPAAKLALQKAEKRLDNLKNSNNKEHKMEVMERKLARMERQLAAELNVSVTQVREMLKEME